MNRRLIAIVGLAGILLSGSVGRAADAPSPMKTAGAELVTLGTGGGPSYRLKRAMTSSAIVIGDDIYLIDTGDGLLRQMAAAGLSLAKVRAVFITHHHFDHNADLGPMIAYRWLGTTYSPLPVIGPPMTREMVSHLMLAYRSIELAPITIGGPAAPSMADTVDARDLPDDMYLPKLVYEDKNVRVSAVLNDHYHFPEASDANRLSRSYALRFDTATRSIVFTGDTGPSTRVESLARNADILISEVIDLERIEKALRDGEGADKAFIDGLVEHLRRDHLTPADVGRLAVTAKVGEVVLSHIVPGWDEETDLGVYSRGVAKVFDGPVHVARDLDRF